ncbi:response regulator [bacterium]|nr:response regulator [bacterium]
MAEVLRLCGADVRVCYDGTTAAQEAVGFHSEVGLFDVELPGLAGCELARRIRAPAGRQPLLLIAVTAAPGLPDLQRVVEAGFNMLMLKPADPAALVPSLADFAGWLRSRRAAPAAGTRTG